MSDGNWTRSRRWRWMRCTKIGTPRATRPATKIGARNPMASAHPHQPFAVPKIAEERLVERLAGVERHVVDPVVGRARLERRDVLADHPAVLRGEGLGHDGHV